MKNGSLNWELLAAAQSAVCSKNVGDTRGIHRHGSERDKKYIFRVCAAQVEVFCPCHCMWSYSSMVILREPISSLRCHSKARCDFAGCDGVALLGCQDCLLRPCFGLPSVTWIACWVSWLNGLSPATLRLRGRCLQAELCLVYLSESRLVIFPPFCSGPPLPPRPMEPRCFREGLEEGLGLSDGASSRPYLVAEAVCRSPVIATPLRNQAMSAASTAVLRIVPVTASL